MKSKRGEKLCLSCDRDYAVIENEKQKKPITKNNGGEKSKV